MINVLLFESFMPYFNNISPQFPCPVRILFKLTNFRRSSEKLDTREHSSSIDWCLSGFDGLQFIYLLIRSFIIYTPSNGFSTYELSRFSRLESQSTICRKMYWKFDIDFNHSLVVAVDRRTRCAVRLLNTGRRWIWVIFTALVMIRTVEFGRISLFSD